MPKLRLTPKPKETSTSRYSSTQTSTTLTLAPLMDHILFFIPPATTSNGMTNSCEGGSKHTLSNSTSTPEIMVDRRRLSFIPYEGVVSGSASSSCGGTRVGVLRPEYCVVSASLPVGPTPVMDLLLR